MKLSKLIRDLSFQELSNLSMGNDGSGVIEDTFVNRIVALTNNALLEIYSRFTIKERELVVQSLDWKSLYYLRSEFAASTGGTGLKYIMDTSVDPFTDDIICVTSVRNEIGVELPLNDSEQYASVFTPQHDVLQLTHTGDSQAFFVTYQARHTLLQGIELTGYADQLIELPVALENALRYKVASFIFAGMAGQDYSNKVQELDAKFERQCQSAELMGQVCSTASSTNVKLHRRGFV